MLKSGSKAGLSGTSKMKSLECVGLSPEERSYHVVGPEEDRGGARSEVGGYTG